MRVSSSFLAGLFLGIIWLGGAAVVAAQTGGGWQWRKLTPAAGPAPEARRNGVAVYDAASNRFVIFGGSGESGLLNDVWALDLTTLAWTKLNTGGTPPPARFAFDGVYDPVGRQLVIYNGQGSGFFNDTWTLDLATLQWRDVSPAADSARPKKRYGSAAVFDPVSRSLVSFAGFTSESGRFNDTQSFSLANQTWQDWSPSGTRPQVRCLLTAAYDSANRRMLIYGGQRSGQLDDLWAFDLAARSWTNLTPNQRPAGRWFANSFVDTRGRFTLFGGVTSSGDSNELWEFEPTAQQWTKLDAGAGPSARSGALATFIEAEQRLLLFGGTGGGLLNDVWELRRTAAPAALTAVSAASFSAASVAPESIVAVFGTKLATTTQNAATANLPTTLADVSAKVVDRTGQERAAGLFFVAPTQLNLLLPSGLATGAARLDIYNGAALVASGALTIAPVAPGLFAANASGQGLAAAVLLRVAADGSQRTEPIAAWDAALGRFAPVPVDLSNAQEQVFLILFGTGFRAHSGLNAVSARVGGTNTPVTFAGAQGNLAGLDQANLRLPPALAGRGLVNVELLVESQAANAVQLQIK